MHFVDRKPKGEQPRLLTLTLIQVFYTAHARMAELADARDLKSLDRKVVRVQSPLWAPKQNERVTIQIHTRLLFKISPLTLVVAIANANRRGFFFFLPPSSPLLHPPRSPCGQDGMFSSIFCGLEALTSRGELEGLAVHPEDTPEAYRSLPVDLLSLDSGRNLPT